MENYLNAVEVEYNSLLEKYTPPNKKIKGIDQCVIRMMRKYLQTGKIWWNAWEVIGHYENLFGSHRAPARISDLSIYYPSYVESRDQGAYTLYRLKLENFSFEEKERMASDFYKVDRAKRVGNYNQQFDGDNENK